MGNCRVGGGAKGFGSTRVSHTVAFKDGTSAASVGGDVLLEGKRAKRSAACQEGSGEAH